MQISASAKPKDRKGAKAPAEGGRSRKRKASAEPEEDRDAGGSPALLVPGPPSMQARFCHARASLPDRAASVQGRSGEHHCRGHWWNACG